MLFSAEDYWPEELQRFRCRWDTAQLCLPPDRTQHFNRTLERLTTWIIQNDHNIQVFSRPSCPKRPGECRWICLKKTQQGQNVAANFVINKLINKYGSLSSAADITFLSLEFRCTSLQVAYELGAEASTIDGSTISSPFHTLLVVTNRAG